MKQNKEEKSCNNCKYFKQHYGWFYNRFIQLSCGHCLNSEFDKRKKLPLYLGCALWEHNAEIKAERRESIKANLIQMRKRIEEMLVILKDD